MSPNANDITTRSSNSAPSPSKPTTVSEPISDLPQQQRFITGHNPDGTARVASRSPFTWSIHDEGKLAFAVPYTTSGFPADLNGDADIHAHEALASSGRLGLVNPGGTVLRCVDFAPGYACGMHRTQSLDYGIVMEGELDMVMDNGERHVVRRGDVIVQRATMHQWVNRSETTWARMMFVLQEVQSVVVGGKELREELGDNDLPPSGH